jgi:hypothetical protein
MTESPEPWSLNLPSIQDDDPTAIVTLTASFGDASNFMYLSGDSSINIDDISIGSSIRAGMFLISFSLNNGHNSTIVPFTIFIVQPTSNAPPPAISLDLNQTTPETNSTTDLSVVPLLSLDNSTSFMNQSITSGMSEQQKQHLLDALTSSWMANFTQAKKNWNGNWSPYPPSPYYKSIKSNGTVEIGFLSEVYVVPNLQMINNGTIYLDQLTKIQPNLQRDLLVKT